MSIRLHDPARPVGVALSFVGLLALTACSDATAPAPVRHLTPEVAMCCGGVPSWTATELALPAGNWVSSGANAMNDSNVVVGSVKDATGLERAARWTNGTPTLLVLPLSDYVTVAWGVNKLGESVGWGRLEKGNITSTYKPIRWTQVASILPTLGLEGYAYDINASHIAVGESRANGASMRHAVKWLANGTIVDIHPAGALSSVAYAINSMGDIAGKVDFADGAHAWVWKGNGTQLDLGQTTRGAANAISAQGVAVGSVFTATGHVAMTWAPGGLAILPFGATEPSIALGISDAQRVVGVSGDPASRVAFTTRSSTYTVLPLPSTWSNATARDADMCGHIVGQAFTPNGYRAVRWRRSACDI